MALPRCSSLGRSLLSRTSTSCISVQKSTPSRTFTSCSRRLEENKVSPKNQLGDEARKRSIAILGLPRRASKSEVESMLKNAGLQIKRSQLRFDRFLFVNDTCFYAELATPEQAVTAISKFHKFRGLDDHRLSPINVLPLSLPTFSWKGQISNPFNRWVYHEGTAVRDAILPIKEGRRVQLSVQTPFWTPQFPDKNGLMTRRKVYAQQLVANAFERFGIEAMGGAPAADGRRLLDPRFFCHLDFKTKEGAEGAIKSMHETELEGRKIFVVKSELNEVRSRQIGRVDMGVLKELQDLGLAHYVDYSK